MSRRAEQLPDEYASKVRKIDREFCNTPYGSIGPVEQKLRSYDDVHGVVFGSWGETAPDMHALIEALADVSAKRHCQKMRAKGIVEARGALVWSGC